MKNIKIILIILGIILLGIIAAGTYKFNYLSGKPGYDVDGNKIETQTQFGIFTVLNDGKTVEMDGEITRNTLKDFNKLEAVFPNIDTIKIKNCGGSLDDTVNLELSQKIHEKGIKTHLMDNGEIASGGVDFFLAGVERTKGKNTKIGVHSWSGDGEVATDFPVGHEFHLQYIKYYKAIGMPQKQAEDFYYFTINAAPAEGIHWMTEEEIEKYNVITEKSESKNTSQTVSRTVKRTENAFAFCVNVIAIEANALLYAS